MLQAPWHTRWQVASPDPSHRNRAQAAFEVHGDCAFFGKCLTNLAIDAPEGKTGGCGRSLNNTVHHDIKIRQYDTTICRR